MLKSVRRQLSQLHSPPPGLLFNISSRKTSVKVLFLSVNTCVSVRVFVTLEIKSFFYKRKNGRERPHCSLSVQRQEVTALDMRCRDRRSGVFCL